MPRYPCRWLLSRPSSRKYANRYRTLSERSGSTLVSIGYGNRVMSSKRVIILLPESISLRRLKDDTMVRTIPVNAAQGSWTRSVIISDSDHVVLSAVRVETPAQRFFG